MLADRLTTSHSGRIAPTVHLACTAKLELVDFVAAELLCWRDQPERPATDAETKLTEYLCDHLNHAAYFSSVWSHVQFRTETGDETRGERKIDLSIKPCGAVLIIGGRRHTCFDVLFPIECKRLPTPKGKDRDEREYVTAEPRTTGGVQRFKLGHHGASHTFAAMIGYVQEHSCSHWTRQINSWIRDLSAEPGSVWNASDSLHPLNDGSASGLCKLRSQHRRAGGLKDCELRHLWIRMDRDDDRKNPHSQ